ncbi:hypothetical protein AYI69_g4214 [Smittium culicis]|uniref:Uncharacterized protein n=1 Tax=Smittium culicis TaxID=133412 RepID=A0A1R1YFI8_9FUNG|nr:hypothetical protein AYI69_g4214 [Smittium culicis]
MDQHNFNLIKKIEDRTGNSINQLNQQSKPRSHTDNLLSTNNSMENFSKPRKVINPYLPLHPNAINKQNEDTQNSQKFKPNQQSSIYPSSNSQHSIDALTPDSINAGSSKQNLDPNLQFSSKNIDTNSPVDQGIHTRDKNKIKSDSFNFADSYVYNPSLEVPRKINNTKNQNFPAQSSNLNNISTSQSIPSATQIPLGPFASNIPNIQNKGFSLFYY